MIDNKLVRAGQPHPAANHRRAAATSCGRLMQSWRAAMAADCRIGSNRVKGRLCRPAGAVSSLRCGPAAASRRGSIYQSPFCMRPSSSASCPITSKVLGLRSDSGSSAIQPNAAEGTSTLHDHDQA